MKQLIIKEIMETRRFAAATLAIMAAILLLRDPLTFTPEQINASGWMVAALLPAFLMGLSSYARENGAETMPFLLSRPVRWWQVLLAKVAAGLLACVAVTLAAMVLYAAFCPSLYRPFLGIETLGGGALAMLLLLAFAFATGLSVSMLAPNLAVALPVALAALLVIASAGDTVTQLYWPEGGDMIVLACLPVAAVVSLLPPRSLNAWWRAERWAAVMSGVLAILLVAALACRVAGRSSVPPSGYSWEKSPDRALTAFAPNSYEDADSRRGNQEVWLQLRKGIYRKLDAAPRIAFAGWRPDSAVFLYAALVDGKVEMREASAADGWQPHAVAPLPSLRNDPRAYLQFGAFDTMLWSPDNSAVAIRVTDWLGGTGSTVVAVDVRGHTARVAGSTKAWMRLWWVDGRRLAVITLKGRQVERL